MRAARLVCTLAAAVTTAAPLLALLAPTVAAETAVADEEGAGCARSSVSVVIESASGAAGALRSPTVSVLVPSFNQGRYVADALRSVADQTALRGSLLGGLDVVVVDDASSDGGVSLPAAAVAVRDFGEQTESAGECVCETVCARVCVSTFMCARWLTPMLCDHAFALCARPT